MDTINIKKDRLFDFVCVGRANIDLYAVERDTSLKATSGFVKSVGGSPANIAVALSRLGAKAGFIGKISKDPLGDFVLEYLASKGVDTRHLTYDSSGGKTSLAFAEVKKDNSEVLFYRNKASDLQLSSDDIEEEYIKNTKAVLLTGTAFSSSPSREAMFSILNYARQYDTLSILDLDYRASDWNSMEETAIYYSMAAQKADIIFGNEEEFEILDYLNLVREEANIPERLLSQGTQLVICKYSDKGSITYTKSGRKIETGVFPVTKLKPYGSGDAFVATLLDAMFIDEKSLEESLMFASAAGAILVSKQGCAEAMPSKEEINRFLRKNKEKQLVFTLD